MRIILIALGLWLAVQQGPPSDPNATRAADLVELVKLDPTIKLDVRYAGTNNFLGKPVYKEARARRDLLRQAMERAESVAS